MKRSAIVTAVIVCRRSAHSAHDHLARRRRASVPIRIRVMSFNIQYGAYYSTIDAVVKAIERADADVVGLQEAPGKTRKIARLLGWYARRACTW